MHVGMEGGASVHEIYFIIFLLIISISIETPDPGRTQAQRK